MAVTIQITGSYRFTTERYGKDASGHYAKETTSWVEASAVGSTEGEWLTDPNTGQSVFVVSVLKATSTTNVGSDQGQPVDTTIVEEVTKEEYDEYMATVYAQDSFNDAPWEYVQPYMAQVQERQEAESRLLAAITQKIATNDYPAEEVLADLRQVLLNEAPQ